MFVSLYISACCLVANKHTYSFEQRQRRLEGTFRSTKRKTVATITHRHKMFCYNCQANIPALKSVCLQFLYSTPWGRKKEPIFFCVHLVSYLTETGEFFSTYIRPKESRSISYNSVYLILICVENFAATVKLNILCLTVK